MVIKYNLFSLSLLKNYKQQPGVIEMEVSNPPQNRVLNDSIDLFHLSNENKDRIPLHLPFLEKEIVASLMF